MRQKVATNEKKRYNIHMNHKQTTITSAETEPEKTYNSSGDILMGMIRQTLGEPIQATVEHNELIKQLPVTDHAQDDNDKENNEHI